MSFVATRLRKVQEVVEWAEVVATLVVEVVMVSQVPESIWIARLTFAGGGGRGGYGGGYGGDRGGYGGRGGGYGGGGGYGK